MRGGASADAPSRLQQAAVGGMAVRAVSSALAQDAPEKWDANRILMERGLTHLRAFLDLAEARACPAKMSEMSEMSEMSRMSEMSVEHVGAA